MLIPTGSLIRTILANSLHFTRSRGKINITVNFNITITNRDERLAAKAKGDPVGTLIISIADSGCGIHQDRLPYIFDEYIQTSVSRSSVTSPGSGSSRRRMGSLISPAVSRRLSSIVSHRQTTVRQFLETLRPMSPERSRGSVSGRGEGMTRPERRTSLVKEQLQSPKGLSLWIAKHLIELHPDYDITAASDGLNKGSTFTLTIPFYLGDDNMKEIGAFDKVESRTSSFDAAQDLFHSRHEEQKSVKNFQNNNELFHTRPGGSVMKPPVQGNHTVESITGSERDKDSERVSPTLHQSVSGTKLSKVGCSPLEESNLPGERERERERE